MREGKLYKCADCRKQFTIKVGTIFEDSAIPLQKWFFAIFLMTAHKKGISSCQLARDLSITQKTAWFMLHRIRYMLKSKSFNKPLKGIVEVDETYVGGRAIGSGITGTNQPNKTPVFGMIQRKGELRIMPVKRTNGKTLKPIIRKNVSPDSIIMSDEFGAYHNLDKEFKDHRVVTHSKGIYVDGSAHTQTIDGFWSLLKRGIFGIYHHVSRQHLDQYCDEFEFRHNSRKTDDTDRFITALKKCEGRLTHKTLKSKRAA
jgi:transposase-like protein